MSKRCDNKSVGVIIRHEGAFAVIKRKNFPVAYAFVAGHLDGDGPEDAAKKEALEEAGITVLSLEKKLEKEYSNPCKRDGGDGHHWYVFEATLWTGELKAASDAKEARWTSLEDLQKFARQTRVIAERLGVSVSDFSQTAKIVEDSEWQKNPGLEPVWVVMLGEIGVL